MSFSPFLGIDLVVRLRTARIALDRGASTHKCRVETYGNVNESKACIFLCSAFDLFLFRPLDQLQFLWPGVTVLPKPHSVLSLISPSYAVIIQVNKFGRDKNL